MAIIQFPDPRTASPEGIVAIGAWLARYRAYWPKRMEALADLLKDMDQ